MSIEWLIARRYLATRRKGKLLSFVSLFAVGGVSLGVTALIVVIAVMTGLQREMQRLILGSTPHIYVFNSAAAGGFRLGDWQDVLPQVLEMEEITVAEPFVMTNVGIFSDYARAGILFGIDPRIASEPMNEVEAAIRAGEYDIPRGTVDELPGLLMGRGLADRVGIFDGDTVRLVSLEHMDETPQGATPRFRDFVVTGVFQTGMWEYDEQYMYADLDAARELPALGPDTVSGIGANTHDPWDAQDVARAVAEKLGPHYYITDWTTMNGQLFSALKLEKFALFVILFLIILVAAFNIVSMLIMVVAEKTREIGILKSMGLTDRSVLRVFMLQGLAIGLIGTTIGAAGGLLLVFLLDRYEFISLPPDVYFIDHLPVALDPLDVILILGCSILIAFISTIHPARQAARLEPVDAIRHD